MISKYTNAVDKYRELIIDAQNYIWTHAETGFREYQTSKYLEDAFEALGYELVKAGDIPGFYTIVDTGRPGPELLIMGEMDSLICFEHPDANPETGAVHCCGHCAQSAALLGIAAALKEPGILDGLSGRIRLCAVPAEELIEVDFRSVLKEEGRIRYMGGKTEFLHRGLFDGVDMAFLVHTTEDETFQVTLGSVGCVAKRVIYKGKSAHAAAAWDGCNALYAATLGLSAINSIRETFKEPDIIRVHPIITKGGSVVNAIPDEVIIESYVRGSNFAAIKAANKKVNRALSGAALAMGANVCIQDTPGYAPSNNCRDLMKLAEEACETIDLAPFEWCNVRESGSSDMGDLSVVMPVVQVYAPGAVGTSHGADYYIQNPELACMGSAKLQLVMLVMLLQDNAARAKQIIADYKPLFATKEQYFAYLNELCANGDRIAYEEEKATVIL